MTLLQRSQLNLCLVLLLSFSGVAFAAESPREDRSKLWPWEWTFDMAVETLDDPSRSTEEQIAAITELRVGGPEALPVLTRAALTSTRVSVRSESITVIQATISELPGRMVVAEHPGVRRALLVVLQSDPSPAVRGESVKALCSLDAESIPALRSMLEARWTGNSELRAVVEKHVGRLGRELRELELPAPQALLWVCWREMVGFGLLALCCLGVCGRTLSSPSLSVGWRWAVRSLALAIPMSAGLAWSLSVSGKDWMSDFIATSCGHRGVLGLHLTAVLPGLLAGILTTQLGQLLMSSREPDEDLLVRTPTPSSEGEQPNG